MKIPAAPWHRPKERYVGNGVYVTDIYGSHLIAALIHWLFVALRRRWKRPAQNQDRTPDESDPASEPEASDADS